ncbi:MAG: DNA (cytosine-5-)-methyltransferase [bacterium]|nr:DNA (cytosine-5-)-methyltransferase [bacterium]
MRAAEFFAGMGLMRAGLERVGVTTVFANDIDTTKAALYRSNWGDDVLVVEDIRNLHGDDIPDAEIATASFPCVDMSLAGNLAGLDGEQSGLITEFCRILIEMGERRPRAVIVENVPGFATVNGGRDFAQVVEMLESLGYAVNSIVVNASAFVPQSRARVFLLGALGEQPQALVRVGRDRFDVRWMDVDEYARLQGAETLNYDSVSERQAMFALGDAVCVPVIEWLGQNWLMRLAA